MDMGDDGPSSLLQHGDEAARGFLGIAPALRSPGHHPGDLSWGDTGTARRECSLHYPCRRAGGANTYYPVAPQLVTVG